MSKLEDFRNKVGEKRHFDIEEYVNIKEMLEKENKSEKIIRVIGAFIIDTLYGKRVVLVDDNKKAYYASQKNVIEFFEELINDKYEYNKYFKDYQLWIAKKYKSQKFNRDCIYWREKDFDVKYSDKLMQDTIRKMNK